MVNVANLIRVGVAAAVGFLVALAAKQGLHLSSAWVATITTLVTGVVAGLYHTAVTWLEKRWPWLGHLLGVRSPATKPKVKGSGVNRRGI